MEQQQNKKGKGLEEKKKNLGSTGSQKSRGNKEDFEKQGSRM